MELGKVTDVKNQGTCGASWAFAATALYESLLAIYDNKLYDLSEQYVLKCTDGSGCSSGNPQEALVKTIIPAGIPLERT